MNTTQTTIDNGNNESQKEPNETKQKVLPSPNETINSLNEPEYVVVKDLISGMLMELPTDKTDNTLGLQTLTHAFPGAHGLKYQVDSNVFRALLFISDSQNFYPPATGWSGKTFIVISNNVPKFTVISNNIPDITTTELFLKLLVIVIVLSVVIHVLKMIIMHATSLINFH